MDFPPTLEFAGFELENISWSLISPAENQFRQAPGQSNSFAAAT